MYKRQGVEINRNLATALYYGLYTDTGEFTEITHSLDRDLRDDADFDNTIAVSYTHPYTVRFILLPVRSDV